MTWQATDTTIYVLGNLLYTMQSGGGASSGGSLPLTQIVEDTNLELQGVCAEIATLERRLRRNLGDRQTNT